MVHSGRRAAASVRVVPVWRPVVVVLVPHPDATESRLVAVGQMPLSLLPPEHEEPVSKMRGADVESAATIPERIVPSGGKVSEDFWEATPDERRDVFDDDVAGLEVSDDPGVLPPKAACRTREASSSASI